MKVNERRTVVGVDWPLCVPPTVERDRRAWVVCIDTGDVFGEMSLLNGVEWRVATVVTDESCQLLVLSRRQFDRYIRVHVSAMYSEKSRFVLSNPYL